MEGAEETGDESIRYVDLNSKLARIEEGIPINQISKAIQMRDFSTEFKLIKKITETNTHKEKQI